MKNLPVNWSEGMFLRPQHFQTADRYWTEVVQTSEQWDHPYSYGLRSIEFSEEAFANYHVRVTKCHARMKDGTLVVLDFGQEPDPVDLKEAVRTLTEDLKQAFDSETKIRVYLAVPKLKMGRKNVGHPEAPGDCRFLAATLSLQDESQGGNDQELELRGLNVRLLLSSQDLSGYEILPIAQIQRVGEADTAPQLDEDYIPPVVAIDAWPRLSVNIIREIYDYIGARLAGLSTDLSKITQTGLDPRELDQILRVIKLNEAYATLGCITSATGVHPWTAYLELCRIVGMLSIFEERLQVEDIPKYDHDDLAYVFGWLKKKILDLTRERGGPDYERRDFEPDETQRLQVHLERRWFHDDWDWYVGVETGETSEQDCRELLTPGLINWKLGSVGKVDLYVRMRAAGLKLAPVVRVPRPLLKEGGSWVFYRVERDRAQQSWEDVEESKTLAIRFHKDSVRGIEERRISLEHESRHGELLFALFAVPQR